MKTKIIVDAYSVLKAAKLSKMDDKDKYKVIKAMREMRPVSEKFEADLKEGNEKLKDERYEEMNEKAVKHNEAVRDGKTEETLSSKELRQLDIYFSAYKKEVDVLEKSLEDEDFPVKFEKLSEEAIYKLWESNDFTCEQMMILEDALG